jgi:predicted esterase
LVVQGAAMSLYSCYFKQEQTLGGVIALSGYLPFANRAEQVTPLLFLKRKRNTNETQTKRFAFNFELC